jgi:hypothetical protein
MLPVQFAHSSTKTYPLIFVPNLDPVQLKVIAMKTKAKKGKFTDFTALYKPDKPPNSFFIFKKAFRNQIKEEYPEMPENEFAIYCGVLWKSLRNDTKKQFTDVSRDLFDQWHVEMAVYKKQLPKKQKHHREQQKLNYTVNDKDYFVSEQPSAANSVFKLTLPNINTGFGLVHETEFQFDPHVFPQNKNVMGDPFPKPDFEYHKSTNVPPTNLKRQAEDGLQNNAFRGPLPSKKKQKLDLNLNFDRVLSSSMRNISAVCKGFKTGWTPTSAVFKEDSKLSRIFE